MSRRKAGKEHDMSSGWEVDRWVLCALPGKVAKFALGHGWASGEVARASESEKALFIGAREHVDGAVLAEYGVPETYFRPLKEYFDGAIAFLRENATGLEHLNEEARARSLAGIKALRADPWRPGGDGTFLNAESCLSWTTGGYGLVQAYLEEPEFRVAWEEAVRAL